ncbi:chromo domain shadow [Diplodia corticola]|uniref:Chromo domain shadow n=1 Tax=Diplodia corticola TaxID=236234 RepID=A0A1J9RP31_9PEZI|nr:chromo domain shadow [Diplodia corticola]OJD30231.1 chromo domain shadow [Diplodia corticola]
MSDTSRPAKRARRTPAPTSKPHHASRAASSSKRNGVNNNSTTAPNGATKTTTSARRPNGAAAAAADAENDDRPATPLPYVPNRAIPPIAPTPPSACPLPLPPGRRARIVSRRYDPVSMQPLYRVRIEACSSPPAPALKQQQRRKQRYEGSPSSSLGGRGYHDGYDDDDDDDADRGTSDAAIRMTTTQNGGGAPPVVLPADDKDDNDENDDDDDVEEHTAPLADILSWVSAAELERFELAWEDDVVVMVDEEGAVLLVSREAQRAMMGWRAQERQQGQQGQQHDERKAVASAAADGGVEVAAAAAAAAAAMSEGEKKGRKLKGKKKPTREFVDLLPPRRRRGRTPKTAKVMMGVVGVEEEALQTVEDTVEGEGDVDVDVDALSETAEYGEWVNPAKVRGMVSESGAPDRGSGGGSNEKDELALTDASEDEHHLGKWRAGVDLLSAERSEASSRASTTQRYMTTGDGSTPFDDTLMPASPVRRSMSSRGASLRRSSLASNNSAAHSFRTADSRIRSRQASAALSRSSFKTGAENGAASLLSAFNSTQNSSSRRQGAQQNIDDSDASAGSSKQAAAKRKNSERRRSPITVPTTSTRHQASSMLHPPAEGSSWEPEVAEEEEYEIESIIRDQFFEGKRYYLVKWANWPPDEMSWFAEEELDGAREVLDAYLEGREE